MKEIYLPVKKFNCLIYLILFIVGFSCSVESVAQTQQVFTTSGAGTFTMPAGVTQVTVECWGGGGNGGQSTTNGVKAGGGGGGAYARKLLTVTPSTVYNLNVGASGSGDSWFVNNTMVLAKGGASVIGVNNTAGALGGPAGTSIGDQVYGGGNGAAGVANSGGGGSSAGNSANGNNAVGSTGGAAPGGGGAGATGVTSGNGGASGNNPGGGGSGGYRQGGGGAVGPGAVGKVVISYYLLTSTSVPPTVCQNTTATVTLTGTAANLPIGIYTVTYNLTGANTDTDNTATMTVSAAGTGTFTTTSLANTGSTTITITKLASGFYASSVGANNTSTFTVSSPAQPTISAGGPITFCAGGSVVLTSSAGSTYKWYADGVLIPSATSQTYTATASAEYTVVITNASGCTSVASAGTIVTVNSLPATPAITADGPTTLCADGTLILTSTAATGYQWYKGGVLIPGATNQDYSPTTTGVYTVTVTNANTCVSAQSSGVSVTINPLPGIPTISASPFSAVVCAGSNVVLTSSSATTYQWYELSGVIGGATAINYSATATGSYFVKVTNSFGCFATSAVKDVTVNPLPDITIASQATGLCSSSSIQTTQLAYTNTDNSPTTYSIVWNAAALGVGFVNVSDVALPVSPISVSVPANAPAATYTGTLTVKNANGCQSTAKTFTVTVASTPNVSNFSISAANGCVGVGAVITINSTSLADGVYNVKFDLSGSNTATNSVAIMTFSGNTGTFTAAALNAGATTIDVTEIALVGCSSPVTATANFTINSLPAAPTISGANEVCIDANLTLAASPGGGLWSSNEPSIASVNGSGVVTGAIAGVANIVYTITDANGCSNSDTYPVTVNALPVVQPITGQTSYCVGSGATLSNATPNGTWSSSNNSIATVDNAGVVDALAIGNAVISYTTQANAAGCVNIAIANIVVNADPTVVPGNDTTVCESSSPAQITLAGASFGGGASGAFWTIENSGSGTLSAQGSGNNPGNIKYTPAANFYGTITLKLTTTAVGTCGTASATRLINITQKPTVTPGSPITVCQSSSPAAITLSTAAVGGSATTGTWSIVAPGGGTLSDVSPVTDPANVTYTPAANASGTVTLRLTTDAVGVCGTTSADRIITLTALPTANGGAQNSVCQSGSPSAVSLSGATIGGGATTGIWTVSQGSGSLSNTSATANPGTVNFTPAANFTGTVKLTLTTDAPGGCLATTAERIIDVTPASTVIAGGPDVVCQSATPGAITLTGATVGGGATTGTWTAAVGTLSSTNPETSPATVTYTPDVNYSGTVSLLLTTNATGNCPAVNATRTITVNPNATITLTSAVATTSQTPCINTAITSITYSVGGGATGATAIGLPAGLSQNFSAGVLTISGTPTVSGPFSYTVTTTGGTCLPATATGTISVSAVSVGGTIASSQIICQNATPADLVLSGNIGTVVKWQKSSTSSFTTFTDIPVTSTTLTGAAIGSLSTSTFFRAVVQSGVCSSAFSSVVLVAVNPPFTPTFTATPSPICLGQSSVLATGGFSTADTIIGGDFTNTDPAGWTGQIGNARNNNTYADITWGYTNNGHVFNDGKTYSTAAGGFMITSGNVNNTLTTPAFSSVGRTSLALQFYQGYTFSGTGTGTIQITVDNGATWTTLATYNSSSPSVLTNPFTNNPLTNIPLDLYLGQPNIKIRFVFNGTGTNSVWALENVNLVGPYQPVNYTWTGPSVSATGSSITVTPTTTGTNTYTIQTSTGGCMPTTTTVSVVVDPTTVAGTLPSNVSICSAGTTAINLAGNTGTVVRWESSIDNGATWSNISNTTTTLNASVVAATTLYRTLVQSGVCPSAYSTTAKAGLHNVWTGAVSTDWQTANNWSDGLLPDATCAVVTIPNTANKPILSNGSATINSLSIQALSALTVNNTGVLTIGGSITNAGTFNVADGTLEFKSSNAQSISGSLFVGNNIKNLRVSNTNASGLSLTGGVPLNIIGDLDFGSSNSTLTTNDNLILRSTATSTARIADITNGGLYTGNKFIGKVTVERYFPADRSWRLLTSPLTSTGSIFSTWQNNGVYTAGKGMFVTGPTPNPAINGLDASIQNNYSIKGWNLALQDYTGIANTRDTILSGTSSSAANKAFFTFVRGDRNRTPDNTIIPNSNITTLSSTGFLQTGTQTFNASNVANGFAMIGNPYASPVDMDKITINNVARRFTVWDPKLNDVGGFVVMEDLDNDNVFTPSPSSLGGQNNYIQSSQAFFVQTIANGVATVVFNETNKAPNNNLGMFKPAAPGEKKSISVYLYKFRGDKTLYKADGTYVEFDNNYSKEIDIEDAPKFINVNETFGSVRNNKFLSVERRPVVVDNDTIYFKLTKTTRRKYHFEIFPQKISQENLTAFVEDKFLNTKTPLNLDEQTNVDFEITSDAGSSAADRFKIVFRPSAIYTDVHAKVVNGDIAVNWLVSSEFNIQHYEVEKSTDGTNFAKLNETHAAKNDFTNAAYNSLDISPSIGYYYYRIKSISNNGVIGYSKTVKVKINKSTPAMYVLPNPVTNNIIQVQMNTLPAGVYDARLLTVTGQLVFADVISHAPGTATETLLPKKKLTAGIYQLKITAPDKKVTVIKVAVE